jgi:hypothetical protein
MSLLFLSIFLLQEIYFVDLFRAALYTFKLEQHNMCCSIKPVIVGVIIFTVIAPLVHSISSLQASKH